jgi:phosphoribosylglycinamide formyltransferase 1
VINIAILATAEHTLIESILKSIKDGLIRDVRVPIVILNSPDAITFHKLANITERYKVNYECISWPSPIPALQNRWTYDKRIVDILEQYNIDDDNSLVCLSAYRLLLGSKFVNNYFMKIMNPHPSFLPEFPGMGAIKKALISGQKTTGVSIHFVDEGKDTGPIIQQLRVPILKDDHEMTLRGRLLEVIKLLYPITISLYSRGAVNVRECMVSVE